MKQKNINTYKEVVDKLPDDTSTTMMKDCVNKNLDDRNRKKRMIKMILVLMERKDKPRTLIINM